MRTRQSLLGLLLISSGVVVGQAAPVSLLCENPLNPADKMALTITLDGASAFVLESLGRGGHGRADDGSISWKDGNTEYQVDRRTGSLVVTDPGRGGEKILYSCARVEPKKLF